MAVVSRPGVDSPYAWRLAIVSMLCVALGGGGIYLPVIGLKGNIGRVSRDDVVVANGHVPLTDLTEDAQVPQAFENGTAQGDVARFTDASKSIGIADVGKLNARGSALADYDSDGDLDVAIAVVGGPLLLLESEG